jgi:hypothetical protein
MVFDRLKCWSGAGVQFAAIVVAFLCAMVAVPFCYNARMDDGVFIGNLLAFIGIPLVVGILLKHPHRSVILVTAGLLLFCPVVYAITDGLAVEFERVRDGYFLGTGSAALFVSTMWLMSSCGAGKWIQAVAAAFVVAAFAFAVFVLLWMVMYFE